jgi:hypothetical protein
MSALAPVEAPASTLQPDWPDDSETDNNRLRNTPIMSAGTGLK